VEVVASLSQGRTAAAQCGLFTHKSVPVIFEPPCTMPLMFCTSTKYIGIREVLSYCSVWCYDDTFDEFYVHTTMHRNKFLYNGNQQMH